MTSINDYLAYTANDHQANISTRCLKCLVWTEYVRDQPHDHELDLLCRDCRRSKWDEMKRLIASLTEDAKQNGAHVISQNEKLIEAQDTIEELQSIVAAQSQTIHAISDGEVTADCEGVTQDIVFEAPVDEIVIEPVVVEGTEAA